MTAKMSVDHLSALEAFARSLMVRPVNGELLLFTKRDIDNLVTVREKYNIRKPATVLVPSNAVLAIGLEQYAEENGIRVVRKQSE